LFAFAETLSEEEIQKAIKAMDSKEIHGSRLRINESHINLKKIHCSSCKQF
jgi:RNA recognition motif-containing protein